MGRQHEELKWQDQKRWSLVSQNQSVTIALQYPHSFVHCSSSISPDINIFLLAQRSSACSCKFRYYTTNAMSISLILLLSIYVMLITRQQYIMHRLTIFVHAGTNITNTYALLVTTYVGDSSQQNNSSGGADRWGRLTYGASLVRHNSQALLITTRCQQNNRRSI